MTRQKYFWIIITLFVASALWYFIHKPQKAAPTQQNIGTPPVTSSATSATQSIPVARSATASSASHADDVAAKYREGLISKDEAINETILEQNAKSLDIYGKVVDQNGEPVVGAKVEGGILLNVSSVGSGSETHFTETDSQGRFSFVGVHGVKIGIRPQKDGYVYNSKLPSQRPADYVPDPDNPLVFRMWKTHGFEALVSRSIDAKIPHDGSSITFDMETGQESDSGDLRVTLSRFPLDVRRGKDKFDWTVKIEMAQGGLMEENDPYPYWAPTNGYQSSFQFGMSSNNVPWRSSLEDNFYFKTSQGQYGLMQFGVYSAVTPARLQIGLIINPSDSQNLESASQ